MKEGWQGWSGMLHTFIAIFTDMLHVRKFYSSSLCPSFSFPLTPTSTTSTFQGFYFSRPCLKGLVRRGDAMLNAAATTATLAHILRPALFPWESVRENILSARQTSGFLTHHDAVTGTAKVFFQCPTPFLHRLL